MLKSRELELEKVKVHNRDKLIDELREERDLLRKENQVLRSDREKLHGAVREILKLTECNKYDNEKAFLSRIKELAQTAIQY